MKKWTDRPWMYYFNGDTQRGWHVDEQIMTANDHNSLCMRIDWKRTLTDHAFFSPPFEIIYAVYKQTNKQLLNNTVLLKREDTQPVFSFKIRGAYNKMASLPSTSLSRGVVACSAGNHAQGVALSARILGCRAVICMPLATPSIKVNAVRAHGGETVEVRLIGNNYDEAASEAMRLEKEEGLALIHPFDDELVIAGQGTIGKLYYMRVFYA